jgi:hypothetical protein
MLQNYTHWAPRRKGLAYALLSVALVVACTDSPTEIPGKGPGDNSRDSRITAPSQSPLVVRTASDQLATEIAGFGGAFVRDGVLNVYLTLEANNSEGQAAARLAINSLLAAGNRPAMPIQFQVAKHSLKQLRAWESTLKSIYHQTGVRTAQVDERNNRFEIAVPDQAAEAAVRKAAASFGIPPEIVVIRTGGPPVVPFVDLHDKVRPAGGGLAIVTGVGGCTYGFNAWIDDRSGKRYMVTAAHCVQFSGFGGVTGMSVYQPNSTSTSLVGRVAVNPASAYVSPGCAPGDTCRESDAALVATDATRFSATDWDIGGINTTTVRGVGPNSGGSTTINGRIGLANASTIFFAGDTLEKVGATTGWTAGVVTGTCVYHSDGVGGGRMCNGVVAAGANHGDSGSPVFWKDPQGAYHLMGILWGGPDAGVGYNSSEFWFSRWQGIKDDLSPFDAFQVTPGGYSCNPPSCPQ